MLADGITNLVWFLDEELHEELVVALFVLGAKVCHAGLCLVKHNFLEDTFMILIHSVLAFYTPLPRANLQQT